jgi:hypothetical protein
MRLALMAALLVSGWLGCGPAGAVGETTGDAKKVGTERIVVPPAAPQGAPQTPGPHDAAPAGASPAPAGADKKPPTTPIEVHKGLDGLPPQVVKMRQRLLDAAYSGDMQKLKVAAQTNETPPIFSVNEIGDPIAYLKSQSGDGQGLEILAILTDVLEASWVRLNPGTPQEMYVWPAFAAIPLDKLEPGQTVELYKIVTSSDLEEMKSVGRYTFYTVGIGPDGTWHWFKPAD